VEAADFVPYMPSILPGIKELLVDPVPEVRKIVALALGAMVGKVWELKPWYTRTHAGVCANDGNGGLCSGMSRVPRLDGRGELPGADFLLIEHAQVRPGHRGPHRCCPRCGVHKVQAQPVLRLN